MATNPTPVTRMGDALEACLSGLNIPIRFRPPNRAEVSMPHVEYDIKRSMTYYADNHPYIIPLEFKVIYETNHVEDEAFYRLLNMKTSKLSDTSQFPGYNRYTFTMKAI